MTTKTETDEILSTSSEDFKITSFDISGDFTIISFDVSDAEFARLKDAAEI